MTDSPVKLRAISFALICGDVVIAEGEISVMKGTSLSCYGAYREFGILGTNEAVGIFDGVIIETDLRSDGSVGLRLRLYQSQEDTESPCGYRQVHQLTTAMTIGADAGANGPESINLDGHRVFEFESRVQA